MLSLPSAERSLWRDEYKTSLYPRLKEDLEVDAVVIGAGITGLTTAYLLKQSGLKVAVLEKDTLGGGTTGRTTGKVTSQHNLIYTRLEKEVGVDNAKVYAQANQTGLETLSSIIAKNKIDCDFTKADNYVYTCDTDQTETFKQEAKVAARFGLPASFLRESPLPFPIVASVKFAGQAKINSQKYLLGLARLVHGQSSNVFEKSKVTGIRDGSPGTISANGYKIHAKHIVVATSVPTLPLVARGSYCFLEYPTESYIVAGKLKKPLDGMHISPDDGYYSILPIGPKSAPMVLVGGESHVAGATLRRQSRYKKLARFAEEKLGVTEITNKWSDRDYITYDGLPLVGKLYPWSKNLYVATAFRKWGLTGGTVAAMILHDLITRQHNNWAEAYDPQRVRPILHIPKVAAKYLLRKN